MMMMINRGNALKYFNGKDTRKYCYRPLATLDLCHVT